jgi:hypothetical protein
MNLIPRNCPSSHRLESWVLCIGVSSDFILTICLQWQWQRKRS